MIVALTDSAIKTIKINGNVDDAGGSGRAAHRGVHPLQLWGARALGGPGQTLFRKKKKKKEKREKT